MTYDSCAAEFPFVFVMRGDVTVMSRLRNLWRLANTVTRAWHVVSKVQGVFNSISFYTIIYFFIFMLFFYVNNIFTGLKFCYFFCHTSCVKYDFTGKTLTVTASGTINAVATTHLWDSTSYLVEVHTVIITFRWF